MLPNFDELVAQAPWADGRITLGFAFDGFRFLPKEPLQALMGKLRETKIQLITYHYSRVPDEGGSSQTVELNGLGILDDRFLVSHGGNPSQEDADIYKRLGMHVSSTPSTELQMAMGSPVAAFRDDLGDAMPRCCSLGIDCHSNNSAFIPGEARLGLQAARASRSEVSYLSDNPFHPLYTKRTNSSASQKSRISSPKANPPYQSTTQSKKPSTSPPSAAPARSKWEEQSAASQKASEQTLSSSPALRQEW